MDHEWGRNVTEFGLGDMGATLAGLKPGPPLAYYVINAPGHGFYLVTQQVPTDTSPQYTYFGIPIPHLHPHFPYGEHVNPDAPV